MIECHNCGKWFKGKTTRKKFCCDNCKVAHWRLNNYPKAKEQNRINAQKFRDRFKEKYYQ